MKKTHRQKKEQIKPIVESFEGFFKVNDGRDDDPLTCPILSPEEIQEIFGISPKKSLELYGNEYFPAGADKMGGHDIKQMIQRIESEEDSSIEILWDEENNIRSASFIQNSIFDVQLIFTLIYSLS